ncbi:MAG TPA: ABC transporter permease, partial [Thermoanaerobaculia bacterium]|nr:ABC transporter permease [Thermoanaerobaculia bacterium]
MSDKVRPAIVELTSARTKEFLRETEAIFWVFGFPLLLALALGFAFREKAPDRIPVGVIAGPTASREAAALKRSPALSPRVLNPDEAHDALRHGKVSLVVDSSHSLIYRYDPTSPDGRTARREADDALQSAAGRRDVMPARDEYVHEQGARYIDFLIPGLLGMNLMGTGMWGMGFTIANARMKKLLKRL